jgi:short-subunit dehydrogenase involved in D-alanine esterification of teichoic acids
MSQKQVLITGATSGIGAALLDKYSHCGDNVIACGRNKKQLTSIKKKSIQNLSIRHDYKRRNCRTSRVN